MKIIRVANILEEGKLGGPQIRITRIAKKLSDKVDTTVIFPKENSEKFYKLLESEKIPYKLFKLSRITKEPKILIRYLFFSFFEIYQLVRFFKKESFDIIHVSGGSWQYKGVIAGKIAGQKVIWHLNDTYVPLILRMLFKLLSGLPDYYIFASERTMKYYLPFIKKEKKGGVVRQPVNTELFSPYIEYAKLEYLPERWKGKKIVGTIANINPIKNLELFIRVAQIVNKTIKNIHFIVVGPIYKNQIKYHQRLIKDIKAQKIANIEFVGASDDVREYLKLIDVFLCTSIAESGPMTLWEAMSMEKAVITTDVGDVKEVIDEDISGNIISNEDESNMANKIIELLNNDKKRKMYGVAARKIIIHKFDTAVCAEQQYQVYRDIVK